MKQIKNSLRLSLASARGINPSELSHRDNDKAERDGQLLATIAEARKVHRQLGDGKTIILISSSGRLRRVDESYRTQIGSPPAVISAAALAYLMMLMPEAALGPGAFRQVLFDFVDAPRLSHSERLALRVIRGTGKINLPFSRRRSLQRQLEGAIHTEARKLGLTDHVVAERFQNGDESVRPAELIAEALRGIAVSDTVTEELDKTRNKLRERDEEVAELQKQLRELKSARTRRTDS